MIETYKRLFEASVYKEAGIEDLGLVDKPAKEDSAGEAPLSDEQPVEQPLEQPQEPQQPEVSDEEKEQEKKAEQELQGKISNVLSDISDMLSPETMRYYKEVEDKAVAYLKTYEGNIDEILDNLPDVGLKIIQTSKKNSFIDRDNICYISVMEGAVDIKNRVKGIPVVNEVNKPEDSNE